MAFRAPPGGDGPRPRPQTSLPASPRGPDAQREDPEDPSRHRGAFGHRPPSNDRRRMLDVRRESHFKYDLKEILLKSAYPPEQVAGFVATVVSKGARVSASDAKDFVTTKHRENLLTLSEAAQINGLIDRYSRWR